MTKITKAVLTAAAGLMLGFSGGFFDLTTRPAQAQIVVGPTLPGPGGGDDPGAASCPNGYPPTCVRCQKNGKCVRACYGGTYCDCPKTPNRCGGL